MTEVLVVGNRWGNVARNDFSSSSLREDLLVVLKYLNTHYTRREIIILHVSSKHN